MSAIRRRWGTGKSVLLPTGIVIGLNTGFSLPADFTDFAGANDKAICIVDADTYVGQAATATSISFTTGSGGGHTGGSQMGNTVEYSGDSSGSGCPSSCGDHSWDGASYGAHTHGITGSFTPKMNKLRLIQASKNTAPPLGGVMFGVAANADQTALNTFDSNGGILAGSNAVSVVAAAQSLTMGAGTLASHEHHPGNNTRVLSGAISGAYTSVVAGGGAHSDHSPGVTITPDITRAAVRMFQIANKLKITGLMGLWPYTGAIPAKWTMIAGWNGRFLEFAAAANGSFAGTGVVTFSGTTGGSSHAHAQSGSGAYSLVGSPHHSSLAHTHGISGSQAYSPARYHMKLIQYTG